MLKNYYEFRNWLESFIPLAYGKEELGLGRISELLRRLGNPQNKFKSIHVAGTAGKGSTAFYIGRLLSFSRNHLSKTQEVTSKKSNLKIGLHVSPHLNYIGERMQINGQTIPVDRLIKLIELIKPAVEKIQKEKPELTPSYFEILVAMSFLYFAKEKVDFAVVEVGLGGRLDATNVLVPEVSVITNIGLDHTEILGDTVEKIAYEKAGIIKPKIPVMTGAKGEALEVIKKVAKEKDAPLIICHSDPPVGGEGSVKKDSSSSTQNDIFRFCTKETAKLAIVAAELALRRTRWLLDPALPEKDDFLSQDAIQQAFSVGFPGRFEEIEPGVILDGAHNPDKMRALIKIVKGSFLSPRQDGPLNVILVLAFKAGKNWQEMVNMLMKELPVSEVIATKFNAVTDTGPPSPKATVGVNKGSAVEPEEIAGYIQSVYGLQSTVYSNSQEAVFAAIQNTKYKIPDTIVLVTGSLYLVGEVRTMWNLPEV